MRLLDDAAALEPLVSRLRRASSIGFDSEGDGYYRYRARLCVLQFGWEEPQSDELQVGLVDGLAELPFARLAPVLGPDGPEKVIHDATFDLRLLASRGLPLDHVFDTAAAARLLGEPTTGLAGLLERHLGIELAGKKKQQLADWGERPLPEERFPYLMDDVRHLGALADALRAKVAEADLVDEVDEEIRHVLVRARDPEDPKPPWVRLKGIKDLDPEGQAIARALALLRERWAEERDVPPARVLSHGALIELARRRPGHRRGLERMRAARGLDHRELLDAIQDGRDAGAPPEDELAVLKPKPLPPDVRTIRRAREKALRGWRKAEAERREVSEQAVLPAHCLRELTRRGPLPLEELSTVDGFGEVRVERCGKALVELLGQVG